MAAAQISHGEFSPGLGLRFYARVSAEMPRLGAEGKSTCRVNLSSHLVKSHCHAHTQSIDVQKCRLRSRAHSLDEFPEDSDNRHIAERKDQRPQIGNAEQEHDG